MTEYSSTRIEAEEVRRDLFKVQLLPCRLRQRGWKSWGALLQMGSRKVSLEEQLTHLARTSSTPRQHLFEQGELLAVRGKEKREQRCWRMTRWRDGRWRKRAYGIMHERHRDSVCLFVCLFVCERYTSWQIYFRIALVFLTSLNINVTHTWTH